jgi:predicted O-methyltransferase YrrM
MSNYYGGWPPGHYYSPIVDPHDPHAMRAGHGRLSAPPPMGIDLNLSDMQELLRRLAVHHRLWDFPQYAHQSHRYYWDNPFFGCHDASIYFGMLLKSRPRRVVEIGTGFSSGLLLDVRERFLDGDVYLTFIDPSFERFRGLADVSALSAVRLLECQVQDTPFDVFRQLEAGDILFIDSSHVLKTGSDVNYCLFEVLPRLAPGVLIHVHDILYPFEYPESWIVDERRSWNEAYALRAFLQYNSAFEIVYWNNFVYHKSGDLLRELIPLCMENEGGSIWLRRR